MMYIVVDKAERLSQVANGKILEVFRSLSQLSQAKVAVVLISTVPWYALVPMQSNVTANVVEVCYHDIRIWAIELLHITLRHCRLRVPYISTNLVTGLVIQPAATVHTPSCDSVHTPSCHSVDTPSCDSVDTQEHTASCTGLVH